MATRLVIRDQAGQLMGRNADGLPYAGGDPVTLDLTGIFNADARCTLTVEVQRMCDLGDWHAIASRPLPLYEPDLDETLDA